MKQATLKRLWIRRLGWLLGIWAASIAVLALVAYLLRLVMNAVGMTA
ncbi:DUF2474 domain-containing protein [Pusillimonas sp. MFBS29]|nr:DUF2474 domain-containing protein [Pusillimonas sp. MFBS29]MCC2595562.1 DUF2474 domain-containing protein [Pusillimonas sp. MFBS29]